MLTHHTTSPPARCSCVSRSRVHNRRRRMMFRCTGYTRSGTARAGGEVTQPPQWSSEVHAPDLALIYYKTPDGCKGGWTCAKHAPRRGEDSMGRVRIKTPDGCKGGWTCAKHAPRRGEDSMGRVRIKTPDGCKGGWTCAKHVPGGRGAEGRLRVKTPDGCKGGWTCAKHAPRRGEDSRGGSESRLPTAVRQAGRVRSMAMTGVTKTLTGAFHGDVYVEEAPSASVNWGFRLTVSMLVVSGRAQSPLELDFHCWPNCNS